MSAIDIIDAHILPFFAQDASTGRLSLNSHADDFELSL
jgi:hypothetical protein